MNRLKLNDNSFFAIGLILTFLFLGNRSYAQQPRIYNGYRWEEIESSIKSGKLVAIENGDE